MLEIDNETGVVTDSDGENTPVEKAPSSLPPATAPGHTDPSDYWVYKRNELVVGSYSMSAFAQKVFAAILSLIDPREAGDLKPITLKAHQLASLLNVSTQQIYKVIDDVTDELQLQVARLPIIEETDPDKPIKHRLGKSFNKVNWFHSSKYFDATGDIVFQFHPEMEVYIRHFNEKFTRYQLRQIQALSGSYSIRIYEILRFHHPLTKVPTSTPKKVVRNINYEELRFWLNVGKSYPMFSKFKEKILDKAKRDLEHTDISFSFSLPEREKGNRQTKITYIQFVITALSPIEICKTSKGLVNVLSGYIGRKNGINLIGELGEEVTRRNFIYAFEAIENGQAINNHGGFMRYCIKHDIVSSRGALNPYNYPIPDHREFLKETVLPAWPELDQRIKEEFMEYGFEKGHIADAFLEQHGPLETLKSDTRKPWQIAKDKKSKLRAKLRDIGDLDW